MPIIFNSNGKTAYSGNESYKQIDKLLKNSSKLKIISPYISLFYAKKLENYSKFKKIYLITAKPTSKSDLIAFKYLTKLNNIMFFIKLSIYFTILEIFALVLRFYLVALILFAIFLITLSIFRLIYGSITHSNISIKTSKQFIHEKIYISNNSAIVGSANLTYSGTHKNIEYIELIKDKEKIAALEKHFDSLWSSL